MGDAFVDRDGRRWQVSRLEDRWLYLVDTDYGDFPVEIREIVGDLPYIYHLDHDHRIPVFFDPQCHIAKKGTETIVMACSSCSASGVYGPLYAQGAQGVRDAGVPCRDCYGSGRIISTYQPFSGLTARTDIKRIGMQLVPFGPVTGCIPYSTWLRGTEPDQEDHGIETK